MFQEGFGPRFVEPCGFPSALSANPIIQCKTFSKSSKIFKIDRFQKIQSPRLLGVDWKIGYWGVANHLKFMGKLSRGRGNARNSAQIKNKFFVTAMLQSRDHPPPGAKFANLIFFDV